MGARFPRLPGLLLAVGSAVACGPQAAPVPDAGRDAGVALHPLDGGVVSSLTFSVVGDTRPAAVDDTANYPTAVISQIYADLAGMDAGLAFTVATGDYMYATPSGSQAAPQIGLYVSAAAQLGVPLYAAMGNHECTGFTADNCVGGVSTSNFQAFMTSLVAPTGATTPYYAVTYRAADSSWTAKLLVTACNAWDGAQAGWFAAQLGEPTTYTFVVRHEDPGVNTAPCMAAGFDSLLAQYPYDILIVGHSHTYSAGGKVLLVGNGGAPSAGYGYAVVQLVPGTGLVATQYDYSTAAPVSSYVF